MSNIMSKIKRKKRVERSEEELITMRYGAINDTATFFIQKYVNKKFSPEYWVENTHGTSDYDEMPKFILYAMAKQLVYFFPLTLGSEKYTRLYSEIENILNKLSDYKLNTQYLETFRVDMSEIEKRAFEMLKHYFKNYVETKGEK